MAYTSINNGKDYFGSITWTADDTSPRTFTGFTCQPDILLGRHRDSGSVNYNMVDSSRGGNKNMTTDTTAAEDSGSHGIISSFNSDGITVTNGTNATYPRLYYNELDPFGAGGGNYVYHYWNVNGGTTSSNTDGDITSTVQVNQTAGISIVTWQETTANSQNIGHGLGAVPELIIVKNRDSVIGWYTYQKAAGNGYRMALEDNTGLQSTSFWNNSDPTTTTFHVGFGDSYDNDNIVAYCFAPKKGFSKFGKFTATSGTDGPFVNTGFKPAFVLVKGQTGTNWLPIDNARDPINPRNKWLRLNTADGEFSPTNKGTGWDFLSNGFKVRNWNQDFNDTGSDPYYYWAFAENPFVSSTGTPVTAE